MFLPKTLLFRKLIYEAILFIIKKRKREEISFGILFKV